MKILVFLHNSIAGKLFLFFGFSSKFWFVLVRMLIISDGKVSVADSHIAMNHIY